jgi:excisionase family DNA binding protein
MRAKPTELSSADGRAWLTVRDAAQYLRVGVDLIYDACSIGGLKHVKLGHRTIRLRREWLDTWADGKAKQFR